MAQGIGGASKGGGGKDPKAKIGRMLTKIKAAGAKKAAKNAQQSVGSLMSAMANSAKGRKCCCD
ncbi:MAG: hypothetical protein FJX76_06665 [Armatimonadetes bacterium]|nr:hypothetical protein [Armatimonadota bacterium]